MFALRHRCADDGGSPDLSVSGAAQMWGNTWGQRPRGSRRSPERDGSIDCGAWQGKSRKVLLHTFSSLLHHIKWKYPSAPLISWSVERPGTKWLQRTQTVNYVAVVVSCTSLSIISHDKRRRTIFLSWEITTMCQVQYNRVINCWNLSPCRSRWNSFKVHAQLCKWMQLV